MPKIFFPHACEIGLLYGKVQREIGSLEDIMESKILKLHGKKSV